MSLESGWTEMNAALKDLRRRWEELRPTWDDAAGRDFEERTWGPLHDEVVAVLRAADRLGPVLDRARRDCT